MTIGEWLDDEVRAAKEEIVEITRKETQKITQKETQKQILQLIDYMIQAGETDQISRLKDEPEFLQAMLEKYHL